ncbi:Rieske (2Fe-2S) protein [Paenibacillus radicis (ex Xue et al. 2023)]|uniref:Rieske (2Fe-2S) protein n=1 Tax=Paenibacillus radicis (ex Xue et al. 2023) TaxID=2972489 RepID=A0ABT1YI86_9BACL|nr:Rieske (2Fe-2S) protein [Paenibacillus radicis (ex Xue et al. 2023)]MCR8632888.1 Rieske (2Fe-2S) protein [Paenibacillus radicis (ex Xue et al. 2023)]
MAKHIVGNTNEILPGHKKIVSLEGLSIGVFNVHGKYYAVKNSCPHQQAPLCVGKVSGTTLPSKPGEFLYGREGEILRCPWHGWEFDLTNGHSLFDPNRCWVKTYEVEVGQAEVEPPKLETYPVNVEEEQVIVSINR